MFRSVDQAGRSKEAGLVRERAEKLLKHLDVLAVTSFVPLSDKWPVLLHLDETSPPIGWDLRMTLGGIGAAISFASVVNPETKAATLVTALGEVVDRWSPKVKSLLNEQGHFLKNALEQGEDVPTAIGGWVLCGWDLRQRPARDWVGPSKAIGTLLLTAAHDWWE